MRGSVPCFTDAWMLTPEQADGLHRAAYEIGAGVQCPDQAERRAQHHGAYRRFDGAVSAMAHERASR